MAHQLGDVLAAVAQGRQVDGDHVEAIEEVLAEPRLLDLLQQIAVAGGDDPRVDADRLRVAHPLELVLLQDPQQLDLELGGGGIDLVEEDGAGVGRLEAAGAVVDGPGERPANMAEKLAFQQVLRQRPAIDADERAAPAGTELMDRLGDQFLPRTGLAQQQDRGVGLGHLAGQAVDLFHGRARADQPRNGRPGLAVDRRNRGGRLINSSANEVPSPSGRG